MHGPGLEARRQCERAALANAVVADQRRSQMSRKRDAERIVRVEERLARFIAAYDADATSQETARAVARLRAWLANAE